MERAVWRAAGSRVEPAARACGWTAEDFVDAAARAAGHALTDYQREFLADASPMRAVLKARQTGFSWLFALEALAGAVAEGRFSIFVSHNREEAAEKVLYARDLYEGLPEDRRPRLLRAGENEMRFAGGGRLLSFPCRAPRGRSRADLYLDEMAFYPHAERVYAGALPVVSHGGRITLASTPFGDRGMFHRALTEHTLSGRFSRHTVPWWRAPWFCTDVPAAASSAEAMPTADRVRRYGTQVLLRLFEAMERTAFRQEYELLFADTDAAFIPWAEIEPCVVDDPLLETWRDLAALRLPLFAGMDVGRHRDPTEIVVVSTDGGCLTVRAVRTLRETMYHEQEEAAADALRTAGILRLAVDATGMGDAVAENLARRFRDRVMPVVFRADLKERMARRVRGRLQRGELRLPRSRTFLDQIHAVRLHETGSGRWRFDAPREDGCHADQFWALALAVTAAESGSGGFRVQTVHLPG